MITAIEQNRYFHVTGRTVEEIQSGLDAAVDLARMHAGDEGREGILVTRHRSDFYTVAVSPRVPFGFTWEREGTAVHDLHRLSRIASGQNLRHLNDGRVPDETKVHDDS